MIDNLKIKVTIADRVYPLTIKNEREEEGIRLAVKKINEMVKQFEQNYEVRDKQDVLAMCALQFASLTEIKSINTEKDLVEAKEKLNKMSGLLDAHLE